MSVDPSARDNIHGHLIHDYVPDYIETKWITDASDIDLSFEIHPFTKDLVTKNEEKCIKQSLINLVLCNYFEKPFRPNFGGDIYKMLFENFGDSVAIDIATSNIKSLINDYEPRVKFQRCDIEPLPDEYTIKITIYVKIIASLMDTSIEFIMNAVR